MIARTAYFLALAATLLVHHAVIPVALGVLYIVSAAMTGFYIADFLFDDTTLIGVTGLALFLYFYWVIRQVVEKDFDYLKEAYDLWMGLAEERLGARMRGEYIARN